jgi:small subunit ribosomal protein S13
MEKGVVAEWLNAADCNFVPIWYVGSNPSHPKYGKTERENESGENIYPRVKDEKKKMVKVDQNRVKKSRKFKQKQRTSKSNEKRQKGRYGCQQLKQKPKRRVPQYVMGVPLMPLRTVEKALRKVYGVGRRKAREVCRACGRRPTVKVGNLETEHVQLMERWMMENVVCAADRRRLEYEAINRHLKVGTVRGMNMRRGLPVRGQRTSTNGMTARKLNVQRGRKVRQ